MDYENQDRSNNSDSEDKQPDMSDNSSSQPRSEQRSSDAISDNQDKSQSSDQEKDIVFRDRRQKPICQPSQTKITAPYLTKYEKARIVGVRALQISRNAPIYVDAGDETDPLVIAERELVQGKIPFVVRRYLPDNTYQDWPLTQLKSLD